VPPEYELTVVLPCLNEAESLETCIRKAQKNMSELGVDGEVLVADNGSTDGSVAIAEAAGARVINVPERGYGAALRAGIHAANSTFVIMADADDSYALDDLGPFVEELRRGVDLVMGNRFAGGIAPGAMPALHRYVGNPVLSWLGRLFFRVPIHDFHCGMRGFRREPIEALGLCTKGMEFASELVVRSALARLTISEVPTTLRPARRSRPPHLNTWRDGWRHLRLLLAFTPRWLFLYPAITLAALGLAGLIALAPGSLTIGSISFDVQTMLASACLLIVGLQMGALALVSRAYATRLNLLPRSPRLEMILDRFALEWGVLVGALMGIAGVVLFVIATVHWQSTGFGELSIRTMRLPIYGMVLIVAGTQLVGSSFMLSLSRIGEA
jgi:hypothetical protein